MTDSDRDLRLETLFADAKQDLVGEAFTAQVMSRTDKMKRRAVIGRIFVAMVIGLLAILLEDSVQLLTLNLASSVIDLDDRLLAQILSPLNNIGALLAFGLVGLRMAYRKIFS